MNRKNTQDIGLKKKKKKKKNYIPTAHMKARLQIH